jgi:pullulanase/glycogen debranching enzyme
VSAGFTAHPSAAVQAPGTYLGLIEKLDYLKELGVNAIELLPVSKETMNFS